MIDLSIFFLGGVFGAVLMDIAETLAARRGITSGVTVALVGRWAIFLVKGTFFHRDIRQTTPHRNEVPVGWLFHFIVGGGCVALLLPLTWQFVGGMTVHPLPYLLFGLLTSALPWFILLPSFGWGWWGRNGPRESNALLASTLSHIPYGLGIWVAVALSG